MNTKLTLTIEQTVIEEAKKYAHGQKRSLSDLIENYLKVLIATSENVDKEQELPPLVKDLRGSFKAPENFDYKVELTHRLSEKYR